MDLLAWGTSAHQVQADANNKYYFPWHYTNYGAVNSTYNTYGYGPSINIGNGNLTDAGGILDWGVSNAIANGGNQIGKWRTLTADEWEYIFNNTSRTDLRYCFARITGVKWRDGYDYLVADNANVNGMILFPDSYIHPTTEGVPAISNANNPRRYFLHSVGQPWRPLGRSSCPLAVFEKPIVSISGMQMLCMKIMKTIEIRTTGAVIGQLQNTTNILHELFGSITDIFGQIMDTTNQMKIIGMMATPSSDIISIIGDGILTAIAATPSASCRI